MEDYDEEVGSQRRVRWMTQVMVVPALLATSWGLSYGAAYCAAMVHCHISDSGTTSFGVVAVGLMALLVYFVARGKIGMRRRLAGVLLLALLIPLAGYRGWIAASDGDQCLLALERAR